MIKKEDKFRVLLLQVDTTLQIIYEMNIKHIFSGKIFRALVSICWSVIT